VAIAWAVEFTMPRQVTLVQTPVPDPGPGEVAVQTLFSGISSGTELLAYRGDLDPEVPRDEALGALRGTFRYPFPYGYSCAGRVEQSRGGAPVGTLVFAFHPHQQRFVVPDADLVALPANLDPRVATLFPLVETALQISLDAGDVRDATVVVLGLGAVGLLTALLLQRAGASVVAGEPQEWRREVATALGLTPAAPADLAACVAERTAGRGVPLVVELSGSAAALGPALSLLAHEGTALVGSWYGTRPVTLPLGGEFHRRRLTIQSTQVSTIPARLAANWDVARRRAVARDLLSELPLERVPATVVRFRDAAAAYEALDRGQPGMLHVALDWAE
jgi:2-desacetyl-2-hydroxyethyl bacteriochlorophyllide A dehydrogenase